MSNIPIAVPVMLAETVATGLHESGVRTQRSKIHKDGDCNGPIIHGIDDVAAIELERPPLNA